MPRDTNTAGYSVRMTLEFTEVNQYGDVLGEGALTFTRTVKVNGLGGLAGLLDSLERLAGPVVTRPQAGV